MSLTRFDYLDPAVPSGEQHYALTLIADDRRSPPVRAAVTVGRNLQTTEARLPDEGKRAVRISSLDRWPQ